MIDASELNTLAVDLGKAALEVHVAVRPPIQRAAAQVKTVARQFASGLAHAPLYPDSITYETHYSATGAEAEIGPDKDRPQGALGNIIEFGTSKNAPIAHLGP